MTSVPRDPAFWKRFSTAVHRADEKPTAPSRASPFREPEAETQESWLDQERRKKRRSRIIVTVSALSLISVVVLVILALIYLDHHGFYMHGEPFSFP